VRQVRPIKEDYKKWKLDYLYNQRQLQDRRFREGVEDTKTKQYEQGMNSAHLSWKQLGERLREDARVRRRSTADARESREVHGTARTTQRTIPNRPAPLDIVGFVRKSQFASFTPFQCFKSSNGTARVAQGWEALGNPCSL
jgi:hypothetical protein